MLKALPSGHIDFSSSVSSARNLKFRFLESLEADISTTGWLTDDFSTYKTQTRMKNIHGSTGIRTQSL
jgi:hypothetical protein